MKVRCLECGCEGDLRRDWREVESSESEESGVTQFACPSCGSYDYEEAE